MKKGTESAKLTFRQSTEGAPQVRAWLMDEEGRLTASALVRDGQVELEASSRQKVLLAPELPEGVQVSPERLARLGQVVRAGDIAKLGVPIFGDLCFCLVKGEVRNRDRMGFPRLGRPACNVRVKVYEVDSWPIFIEKIPDLELIDIGKYIPKIPWPPEPPPVEGPIVGPFPGPDPSPLLFRKSAPGATPIGDLIPLQDKLALESGNPSLIKATLLGGELWFKPLLCRFKRLLKWYTKELVDTVITDSDGTFTAWFIHSCSDKPDLAFTVEVMEDGVWTQVYADDIPCDVRWNVKCPVDVTIYTQDPRVPTCGGVEAADGKVTVVSFGHRVSPREVDPVTGEVQGEAWGAPWAFGGEVEPRVVFGDNLAFTHYRWSRKVGSSWEVYVAPVSRNYLTTSDTFASISINDPNDASMIQVKPDLPANGTAFVVLNERTDLATARFFTEGMPDGEQRFRLEFFRKDGESFVPVGVSASTVQEVTSPAPFASPPAVATALSSRRFVEEGQVRGYEILLRVDNRSCAGAIGDPTIGAATVNACGFLEYGNAAALTLRFDASQPGDYGTWTYGVVRGTSSIASVSGAVADTSVTGGLFTFTRLGDTFTSHTPVSGLLGSCPRAAFAATLHVYARVTDGYGRLSNLDAYDVRAFALTPIGG
jgi:hypothetical protein